MITMAQMYWLTRMDSINDMFSVVAFIFTVTALIIGILWFIKYMESYDDGDRIEAKKWFYKPTILCGAISIIFWVLCSLTPTTKEMALIYVVPKVINNEKVQQIPDKLLGLANAQMDKWVEDIKEDKEGK